MLKLSEQIIVKSYFEGKWEKRWHPPSEGKNLHYVRIHHLLGEKYKEDLMLLNYKIPLEKIHHF